MRTDWVYAVAESTTVGLMKCCSCGKPVESGRFRYRDNGNRFVVQHRECSADAAAWRKIDQTDARNKARNKAMLEAAIKFRDTWGVDDLDDLISSLEE